MRSISLRDFQRQGSEILPPGDPCDPLLLADGKESYFLVPVQGEAQRIYDALCRAMGALAVRETQMKAREVGLDTLTMEDIEAEIRASRDERRTG